MTSFLIALCAEAPVILSADLALSDLSELDCVDIDGIHAVIWRTDADAQPRAPEIRERAESVRCDAGLLPASWPIQIDDEDLKARITASRDELEEVLALSAGTSDLVFRQPLNSGGDEAAADAHATRRALEVLLGEGDGPARFVTSFIQDDTRRAFGVLIEHGKAALASEWISNWIADSSPDAPPAEVFGPLPPYLFAAPYLERIVVPGPETAVAGA